MAGTAIEEKKDFDENQPALEIMNSISHVIGIPLGIVFLILFLLKELRLKNAWEQSVRLSMAPASYCYFSHPAFTTPYPFPRLNQSCGFLTMFQYMFS